MGGKVVNISGEKIYGIARCINRGFSKKRILEEISKCELVCAVCHRIRTHITRKGQ